MLLENGKVREVRTGTALVLIRRSSACQSCSARGACMTFGSNKRLIEVRDPVGVAEGDDVEIGIKPARVVWASFIVYVLPVTAMILAAMVGMRYAPDGRGDEVAAICAFSALALSALAIFIYDRFRRDRVHELPQIVRVIDSAQADTCEGGEEP